MTKRHARRIEQGQRRLIERLCRGLDRPILLVDAGSGGKLKKPWRLLPTGALNRLTFDADTQEAPRFDTCLSDREGEMLFHVAWDERGSSLLEPDESFIARYGIESLRTKRTERVRVSTLDAVLSDQLTDVEALDVNVEGHDAAVLTGAGRVFEEGRIGLAKVEFELQSVWQGQSYFADVDRVMRGYGYALSGIDIDRLRPGHCPAPLFDGEPVWGKAIYSPGPRVVADWGRRLGPDDLRRQTLITTILSLAAALPSRAIDALRIGDAQGLAMPVAPDAVLAIWQVERRLRALTGLWHMLPTGVRRAAAPLIEKFR